MRKIDVFILGLLFYLVVDPTVAEGQILKGFGKKLEQKLENRIERKTDRQVEKVLDKADKKSDESINDAFSKPKADTKEKKSRQASSPGEIIVPEPSRALVLLGGNCQDFCWFKKGARLVYESLDDKQRVDAQIEMHVVKLSNKGAATISDVEATMSTPKMGNLTYTMKYICDDGMIYMDIASMMQAMMENNPELKSEGVKEVLKNSEIDFSKGFASFPKTMYPGMELENLSFSFKTKAGGSEMSFQTEVTDRVVVAREKVTTKAGTFDCLKIRSRSNTAISVMGIKQNMPISTEYLWIAPDIGMIKQEMHSKTGITAVKLKTYKL